MAGGALRGAVIIVGSMAVVPEHARIRATRLAASPGSMTSAPLPPWQCRSMKPGRISGLASPPRLFDALDAPVYDDHPPSAKSPRV